ncbi:hypothetical protein [Heyndrickxia acidiproducens]|jgi:predicted transposase/invertase (TIGR01784 family)|uniref:hypothetical protein n=1 Tax=Heyndrickxia acidiproducens TaxID=1121084 RepID=UPI00037EFC67|nr:hypothetical protein [Heyndrickxia acidiproducens]
MNEQEVREAIKEWESLSANQENKVLYEARLKYLRDQLSNIMGERRAGREEGKREVREAMIRNMLNRGMDSETIAEISGCTVEDIEDIKRDMNS